MQMRAFGPSRSTSSRSIRVSSRTWANATGSAAAFAAHGEIAFVMDLCLAN